MVLRCEVARAGVGGGVAVRPYLALGRLMRGVGDEVVLLRGGVPNNVAQLVVVVLIRRELLGLDVYLGALLVEGNVVNVRVGRLVGTGMDSAEGWLLEVVWVLEPKPSQGSVGGPSIDGEDGGGMEWGFNLRSAMATAVPGCPETASRAIADQGKPETARSAAPAGWGC